MVTKKQVAQALSDVDRVFLAMQGPLKRVAKSLVKERRERKRGEAARQKEREAQHSIPSPFTFDTLEDQTAHALNILRILELTLMEGNNNLAFTEEDVDAMAGLLASANTLLEPLDLQGVAGALHLGEFTIIADKQGGRPTIACAKCSQGETKRGSAKEASQ